jgi:hypothetical protein
MRTLYESILDDEDVLISNTKKHANNPFIQLANILKRRNSDYILFREEIMNCVNKIEIPFDGEWSVDNGFVKFTLDPSKSKRKLKKIDCEAIFISNTPVVRHTYKVPDNAELVVAVIPSDSKFLSKVLKSLKIRSYDDKIDEMAKQYDLRLHEIEEKIVKTYII